LAIAHVAQAADTKAPAQSPPRVTKPAWAVEFGADDHGTWATCQIGAAIQKMRFIPAGTFEMGMSMRESGLGCTEPVHEVHITRPFWMGDCEVTQELWVAVMGVNPSRVVVEGGPVESVSWNDCSDFLRQLNERVPKLGARLPTEAQWEYACRAGTTDKDPLNLDTVAWHWKNGGSKIQPVKGKAPNAWGLFDMLGNAREWVADWNSEYTAKPQTDPVGPDRGFLGPYRGIRSPTGPPDKIRPAMRDMAEPESRAHGQGLRFVAPAAAR
jgi:formylglycine-generating enzyme required for sulfatase activity